MRSFRVKYVFVSKKGTKNRSLKETMFYSCVYIYFISCLLFPTRGGRMQDLSSECKIDQTDTTDWMSLLPSNPMVEINPNPEPHSKSTKSPSSAWDSLKDK